MPLATNTSMACLYLSIPYLLSIHDTHMRTRRVCSAVPGGSARRPGCAGGILYKKCECDTKYMMLQTNEARPRSVEVVVATCPGRTGIS